MNVHDIINGQVQVENAKVLEQLVNPWSLHLQKSPSMSWPRTTRERGLEACAEDEVDGSRFVDQALRLRKRQQPSSPKA
jgi:hypothetical protein